MSQDLTPSRRDLVKGGAALAVVVPGTAAAASARPFGLQDAADWKGQLGWQFAVAGETGSAAFKLIEVKDVRRSRAPLGHGRSHGFTALFETDAMVPPEGGKTYDVRHPQLGAAKLYIERTTRHGLKTQFRATFS